MRLLTCLSLLTFIAPIAGCSSNSSHPAAAGGTSSQVDNSTGGQSGLDAAADCDGGADLDSGETSTCTGGCPVWPQEKLAPVVGPFFYGTHPGPCRIIVNGSGYYYMTYDSNGLLTKMDLVATNTNTLYTYTNGLLTTETTGQNVTTYAYTANSLSITATTNTGVTQADYTLDDLGYPQAVTVVNTPAQPTAPTHYQHEYKNCQLVARIAYNADNSINDAAAAQYSYDDQGNLIERATTGDDEVYDYSCWN